jgi:diguanylate cyclase (GGDEF)-like protein
VSTIRENNEDILIVDDNPTNLDLLSGMLTQRQFRVRVATGGRRALMAARTCAPDLIMLDINMPDMDGYEVCRQLKADDETKDIPVIFISALDEAMDKVRAFESGGADYVTKPFQFEEVLARIEHQLKIFRLRRELMDKNSELEQSNRQLERANRLLMSLSYLDALTGIPNRRQFDEVLEQEWRRAHREGWSLSLVMLDIDLFKQLNDTYGHQTGDECLRRVAAAVSASLHRAGDVAARFGGEEFAIVLPVTDVDGARALAEEIRLKIHGLRIPHETSPNRAVTVSLGVASVVPHDGLAPEWLVAAADRALYRAKHDGRNRTSVAEESAHA